MSQLMPAAEAVLEAPAPENPSQAGAGRLIWDALTAPGEAFAALDRMQLVPLVAVLSVVNVLIAWASLGPAKAYSLGLVAEAGNTLTPDKEYLLLMVITVATLAAGLLTPFLIWLFHSGLVALGGLFLRRRVRFRQIFRMVVLAGMPFVVGNAVKAVLIHLRPASEFALVQSGLVFLAPDAAKDGALYFALSHLDPFSLWSLALLGLGIAALYRLTLRRALALVACGWGLYLAVLGGIQLASA